MFDTMSLKAKNVINSVLDPESETRMDGMIQESAEEVKGSHFEEPEGVSVGVETEFYILDGEDSPVSEKQRDELIDEEELENVHSELGAEMAEVASEPVHDLESLDELREKAWEPERRLREKLRGTEFQLMRHGADVARDI